MYAHGVESLVLLMTCAALPLAQEALELSYHWSRKYLSHCQ